MTSKDINCMAPEPEPVAWMVKNGFVCSAIYRFQKDADNYAADQQKRHDLGGSLASFCVIPLYTAPPAPSVPDGWRPFLTDVITAAGLLEHGKRDKGLAGRIGKFAFDAMRAAPTPAEAPADLVQDSVASEPVGYLYTNLQSGDYHVSDADDDYRGPERALWYIEPVYRRTKG